MKVNIGLCPTSLSGVTSGLGLWWCPTLCKTGFMWISPLRTRQAVSCITPICSLPDVNKDKREKKNHRAEYDAEIREDCAAAVCSHLPSSSLMVAAGLLTLSPFGGLNSGTGGCSAATHVGSALFMSSLLTELSSWREAAWKKDSERVEKRSEQEGRGRGVVPHSSDNFDYSFCC